MFLYRLKFVYTKTIRIDCELLEKERTISCCHVKINAKIYEIV